MSRCDKARVAGPFALASLDLQVLEEPADECGFEVLELKRTGCLVDPLSVKTSSSRKMSRYAAMVCGPASRTSTSMSTAAGWS